jgi:hypothetical protein
MSRSHHLTRYYYLGVINDVEDGLLVPHCSAASMVANTQTANGASTDGRTDRTGGEKRSRKGKRWEGVREFGGRHGYVSG